MFVNLYSEDNPSTEVAPTIDISCHGARVVSKRRWQPNQQVSVRSIRGNFYSRARVVHCQPHENKSFVLGIEMHYPTNDWTSQDVKKPIYASNVGGRSEPQGQAAVLSIPPRPTAALAVLTRKRSAAVSTE
jgi:hypothetical protein